MGALDANYKALAMAVVKTACLDYLSALKRIRHYPDNKNLQNEIAACERFFQSEEFDILCDLDGPELMRMLRKKANDDKSETDAGGEE